MSLLNPDAAAWLPRAVLAVLVFVLSAVSPAPAGAETPERAGSEPATDVLRFFAIGDVPYSDAEYEQLVALLQQVTQGRAAFIVHVGDIKGGGQPCSDAYNARIARLFRAQPIPILYTPGDNEWTDCHRRAAGRRDPLDRLEALRQAFFIDPEVLRRDRLQAVMPDPAYPENAYLLLDDVAIALVHVVGSDNNLRRGDQQAMAELDARSAANRALLKQAAAAADERGAKAFVVVFHANPGLERLRPAAGFEDLHEDLRRLLRDFSGPVLAIHGDTHRFRFDQPLRDPESGEPIGRFWRLEVPGSPVIGGVWVSVDPSAAKPFESNVVYPSALDAMERLGER